MFLVRIDSSMVSETCNKLKQSLTVGRKAEGKEDRKQIRYTMPYDGFAAKLAEVLFEIAGFTYEKGHRYKLRVRKTILAYVISPLSDKIRLVVASGGGPMLKYIVSEEDFRHITSTMKEKEQLTYVLVLANVYKKGLQKMEITFVRI